MDRRDAIKRLAAGTGVVVGATTLSSSPAFAYDLPTVVSPPGTPTFRALRNYLVRLDRVLPWGTATCPGSAINSGNVSGSFQRWDVSVANNPSGTVFRLRTWGGTTVGLMPPAGSVTNWRGLRIHKRNAADTGNVAFVAGDSFNIGLVVRFTCRYAGRTVTLDHTTSYVLTNGPGPRDWTLV